MSGRRSGGFQCLNPRQKPIDAHAPIAARVGNIIDHDEAPFRSA
jgi:hypothetical protein